jgi:hypothetical protein
MSRFRMLIAITAVAALTFTSLAVAAVTKVTGGTTQITVSSAVSGALSANHITVAALAPATASGTTFTFPISRGHLNTQNLRGVIVHNGGLSLSNGTKTVRLRKPTIVSTKSGVSLFALVRGRTVRSCHHISKHRVRCLSRTRTVTERIARVTGVKATSSSATGKVNLTAYSAGAINALAGKKIASAGTTIGTATVTPKLG